MSLKSTILITSYFVTTYVPMLKKNYSMQLNDDVVQLNSNAQIIFSWKYQILCLFIHRENFAALIVYVYFENMDFGFKILFSQKFHK